MRLMAGFQTMAVMGVVLPQGSTQIFIAGALSMLISSSPRSFLHVDRRCWHYDHCRGRSAHGLNLLNAL